MRSIKFYLILLFAICTFAVNAQTPQGYPANYANGPRFKALVYYIRTTVILICAMKPYDILIITNNCFLCYLTLCYQLSKRLKKAAAFCLRHIFKLLD